MSPPKPLLRCRFRLRTLLVAAPVTAWLIASGLSEPVEEVDAWIIIHRRGAESGVAASCVATPLAPGEQEHHAEAVRSESLLAKSLERPDVAALPIVKEQKDAVQWLRGQLDVDVQDQSSLIRLSLRGRRPEELAKILDSVAATYSLAASGAERAAR